MPPGFPRVGRRAALLRRTWVPFVGPRLWATLCHTARITVPTPDTVARVDTALAHARAWWGSDDLVGCSILAVMRAAAYACEAAHGSADGVQRALAALFDACVDLLPTDAELAAPHAHVRARVGPWCAALAKRGWHATQFPSDRVAECPVSVVWLFRDAFMMGPMRSGGSAASTTAPPPSAAGDPTMAAAAAASAPLAPPPPVVDPSGGAGRMCEHVPVSIPTAVYAGYDRHDALFALLHQGWPHKLQPREITRLVRTLLDEGARLDLFFATSARQRPAPTAPTETRQLLLRRVHAARAFLCRWWAYARLGRWPGDVPLMDWSERVQLVRAVDLRALATVPPTHWGPETADGGAVLRTAPWREWILFESRTAQLATAAAAATAAADAPQRKRRLHCATGVTLAMQAVVIESVRRLAPLRWYLHNHSRWAEFETESIRARNEWRRTPLALRHTVEPPGFFSDLMAMASRDTDPHMWLVHVGRCLRSRGTTAAPLSDPVERAFRLGIAALPELARVAWPVVTATRPDAPGVGSPVMRPAPAPGDHATVGARGAKLSYAMRQIQIYVGRLAPSGEVRPEWDARVPTATMAFALALGEVYSAALAACGVDAAGCSAVFRAVRDLYVCTTGPRVQATALVAQLELTHPRILPLLVALHNVCVDRMTLRATPLDAHTTVMQMRAQRSMTVAAGRADWLMVCHNCARPHTLVVEFDARARAALQLARLGCAVASTGSSAAHKRAAAAAAANAGDTGAPQFVPLPVTDHGCTDVSVDVHEMAYVCNARPDGAYEPIYPVKMTGLMVWFQSRCYTVCPQCGRPAQINPQQCAYVNGTFACARCTGQLERLRAHGITIPLQRVAAINH